MLYAMKDNRQVKISEDEKQKFIDAGYKIAEFKDGKLKYEKVLTDKDKALAAKEKEISDLKAKIEALESDKDNKNSKKAKGEGK